MFVTHSYSHLFGLGSQVRARRDLRDRPIQSMLAAVRSWSRNSRDAGHAPIHAGSIFHRSADFTAGKEQY
jgi:hypothetical protein